MKRRFRKVIDVVQFISIILLHLACIVIALILTIGGIIGVGTIGYTIALNISLASLAWLFKFSIILVIINLFGSLISWTEGDKETTTSEILFWQFEWFIQLTGYFVINIIEMIDDYYWRLYKKQNNQLQDC